MSDAFLCDGTRTPIGRYGGALSSIRPDDLAAIAISALLDRNIQIDPAEIDDVILGCANQAGEDNRNVARMSALLAGLPVTVAGVTVNRLCGSGLNAIAMAAQAISSGDAQLVVAGGVESMSRAPFVMAKPSQAFARAPKLEDSTLGWRFVNPEMEKSYGVDAMAQTAENVAKEHGISRADQDAFAYRSQKRCSDAANQGIFHEEITPVVIPQRKGDDIIFDRDEHPRPRTSLDELAKLKSITGPDGSITAGNASGLNDGAAAMFIASEAIVKKHNLNPIARIKGTTVAGVAPRVMGMGPVPATQKLLKRLNLSIDDIDVIELNEAFAAQGLAVTRQLGLNDDSDKVNRNGGAIALGHPLGMSGARILMSAANELKRSGGTYGLATMCVGVGQGIATVIEAC